MSEFDLVLKNGTVFLPSGRENTDIGIKEEICREIKVDKTTLNGNIDWDNIEFDHLLNADNDRSLWRDRNDEWDKCKQNK